MCGIAGIWNRGGQAVQPEVLSAMAHALHHRGPDGEGVWSKDSIGFAHRRLSIIDLSDKGAQPFVSSDARYALTFNGEIYNYRQLRQEYFADDVFVSDSDTEVLLKLLIRFGKDAIPKLRGMFAFAFFDVVEERLLFACDPFGKKPLYYAWVDETLLFASEPKALFASGYIKPQVSPTAISDYMQHEYVAIPNTAYQNILALPGGRSMTVTKNSVSIATWWRPNVLPKSKITFDAAAKKFDDLLGQAVERRMVADVPVGIFLSGGLDSSTIAWYMRQVHPTSDIHSCSVSFDEESFNESSYADDMARALGTTHHNFVFTRSTMRETLQELLPIIDVPLADASLLPTYAVSKLARQYMKVVLGGDGADELLGGYGTFDAYEIANTLSWMPGGIWKSLEYAVQYIFPVSHRYFSFDFKLKSFLRGAQFGSPENLEVWLGAFTFAEAALLLSKSPGSAKQLSVEHHKHLHLFDQASLLHIQGYLSNDILVKFDRATMAASLEARTPFLDTDLAEFVLRLPVEYKRHKRILCHVMQGRLPADIISRKKQGFGIPVGKWFMQQGSIARQILTQERISAASVFNYSLINELLLAHEKGVQDNRKKIYTLMMYQLWYEYWIMGRIVSPRPGWGEG
ncbi:MAG: asparagine synthase (glutamine-hydrolyzing) [Candidatus Andersenbacteria bacterium RIFCSPHIGHO2_12_FULL_45_11]|uniref:asparagine synthase (glutamine-hydrolyzing) n=1 Tax=Candidatus Andersenbacteria bacterium RIFCSPHIGHO2_12_FULL_45_11 TaxID=1797281 RepID=A0A1G1X0Q1_9BACT|nr:MAG: asparagine synthase (glutamine-hydrolyzing) [Candidatus Andersenbacteria bacterium RIFCSPHIGHO2_12_FULL_45_11]